MLDARRKSAAALPGFIGCLNQQGDLLGFGNLTAPRAAITLPKSPHAICSPKEEAKAQRGGACLRVSLRLDGVQQRGNNILGDGNARRERALARTLHAQGRQAGQARVRRARARQVERRQQQLLPSSQVVTGVACV